MQRRSLKWCLGAAALMPTYKADPDTYKVIFEDTNYRVIEANHKKGVHGKMHGHPVSFVVVNLTDCKNRLYGSDGKTTDDVTKGRTVQAIPAIPSHSAENIGDADCRQIFVEKKSIRSYSKAKKH
jgi:hypothetical protein